MIWKSVDFGLTENARTVLERRYLIKDENGDVVESPEEMFRRVAKAISAADANYNADQDALQQTEEQFYSLLINRDFMPNSPTLMNAGKESGQLSACFVVPIEDSMESIFDAIKATAMIHKTGGGTGFTFTHLRPQSSRVKTTGGVASGPVSFMKVFDAATQAVKQGGCVAPDTRISTGKGLLPIKKLGPADAPPDTWHKYNPHPVAVATDSGIHISNEFYNHGISPVLTMETKNGYKVTATPEHRFRVIDKDGEYVWRYLKDIKDGDWMALQKDTYLPDGSFALPPLDEKGHFNSQRISVPDKATFELGEFIGYLTGDGAISVNKRGTGRLILTIADKEKDVAARITKIIKELFAITPVLQKKKEDQSTNYFFNSTNLVNWLKQIGIEKPSAIRVVVPELVFKAGRQFARGFIRGLFTADGTVSKDGYPSLSSVSEPLLKDLQQLLLSLGMPSAISTSHNRRGAWGTRPLYRLRILTLEGIERFADEIGFISQDKNKRLLKRSEKAWEFNDIIPNQGKYLRGIYDGPGRGCASGKKPRGAKRGLYRKLQHYLSGVTAPRNLTRERLKRLVEAYGEIKNDQRLKGFLTNNQFYDRVIGIKKGRSVTLDLSVPENNTYIANGFVSHNTRRGANMGILRVDHPDIIEFITCKQSDKSITNFNISVAITDEFMKKVDQDKEYDLIDPHTKEVTGQLNARKVFDLITQMSWKNGEPGVVFIDQMNRFNPTPALGEYESTNPCVTGDTLIPTEYGLMKIKDIVHKRSNGKVRIFIDPRTVKDQRIFGGTSLLVPAKAFSTGKKEFLCLKTKAGYELKLTSEHRVLTEKGWVAAKDLVINEDKILIQSIRDTFSLSEKVPFSVINEYRGKNGRQYKTNLPDVWSEDLGVVLGWLVGDGNLHGKDEALLFYFGKDDHSALKEIRKTLKSIYGKDGSLSDRGGEWQLSFNSKLLFRYFTELGARRLRAHQKSVPETIFTAPREAVKGFLKGIFGSDGTINYIEGKSAYARLSSASIKLLQDVQLLLLNFGIFSRIYENRKNAQRGVFRYQTKAGEEKIYDTRAYHELEISRDDVITFIKEIGFAGDKHKVKIEKLLKKAERKRGYYQREKTDTVIKLEPAGMEEVFDMAVPIAHSFIANGCVVHNCGEQILLPYESCNLGSINLSHMLIEEDNTIKVDWDKLEAVTHQAVHFLDNVIDVNSFPLPEIKHKTKLTRKIGLGVMGWADMLVQLGIAYNSAEAIKLAEEVMGFIYNEARQKSIDLAEERGVFPAFDGSVYDKPDVPRQRNATLTTIAPTGTISIISGCASGIEPYFALSYYRKVMDNDKLIELNPYFEALAKENGFWTEELSGKIAESASIAEIEEIPAETKNVFVASHDIAPVWHIRMQAAFQKYTDNAVSKTINFPNEATVDDVRNTYMLAYKSGCKGLTVYRDRSREEQVLNTGTAGDKPESIVQEAPDVIKIAPKPRPSVVQGTTSKVQTGCGNLYVTINEDQDGYPFEVFLQMGKAGGCAASQLEAVGRLVSLAFRAGIDIKSIVDQLASIRCPSPSWEKGGRIFSCADAIAKVIERRLANYNANKLEDAPVAELSDPAPALENHPQAKAAVKTKIGNVVGVCPDCSGALCHVEGCMICNSCGYSKCG